MQTLSTGVSKSPLLFLNAFSGVLQDNLLEMLWFYSCSPPTFVLEGKEGMKESKLAS